jgi:hypothetical protein
VGPVRRPAARARTNAAVGVDDGAGGASRVGEGDAGARAEAAAVEQRRRDGAAEGDQAARQLLGELGQAHHVLLAVDDRLRGRGRVAAGAHAQATQRHEVLRVRGGRALDGCRRYPSGRSRMAWPMRRKQMKLLWLLCAVLLGACGSGGPTSYPMRSTGGVRFGKFNLMANGVSCSGGASSGAGESFRFNFTLLSTEPIGSLTGISFAPFATAISQTIDTGQFNPCMDVPWTGSPETPDILVNTAVCQSQSFISIGYSCGANAGIGRASTYAPATMFAPSGTATLALSGLLRSGAAWSTEVDVRYSISR